MILTTGQLAKLAGLSRDTLERWAENGLAPATSQRRGKVGRLLYSDSQARRVLVLAALRAQLPVTALPRVSDLLPLHIPAAGFVVTDGKEVRLCLSAAAAGNAAPDMDRPVTLNLSALPPLPAIPA